jgi:hypothetical protein
VSIRGNPVRHYEQYVNDTAWFGTTVFGSGVAKAIVERIYCSGGGGQYWPLDYAAMSASFEFTEKQIRAAVARLIAHDFARIEVDGDCCDGPALALLTPSRLARDAQERDYEAARTAERAARAARRGGRATRATIPEDIRAAVYVRDGGRCQKCGTDKNLTMDHRHPWSLGGPDTVENLQVLCRSCNSRKGARA